MSIEKIVSSVEDIPNHVLDIIESGAPALIIEVIDPNDNEAWIKSTLPFDGLKDSCPRKDDFKEAVCAQIDTFFRLANDRDQYIRVNGKLYQIPSKNM